MEAMCTLWSVWSVWKRRNFTTRFSTSRSTAKTAQVRAETAFSTQRTRYYCCYFCITRVNKHTFTPRSVDNQTRIAFLNEAVFRTCVRKHRILNKNKCSYIVVYEVIGSIEETSFHQMIIRALRKEVEPCIFTLTRKN